MTAQTISDRLAELEANANEMPFVLAELARLRDENAQLKARIGALESLIAGAKASTSGLVLQTATGTVRAEAAAPVAPVVVVNATTGGYAEKAPSHTDKVAKNALDELPGQEGCSAASRTNDLASVTPETEPSKKPRRASVKRSKAAAQAAFEAAKIALEATDGRDPNAGVSSRKSEPANVKPSKSTPVATGVKNAETTKSEAEPVSETRSQGSLAPAKVGGKEKPIAIAKKETGGPADEMLIEVKVPNDLSCFLQQLDEGGEAKDPAEAILKLARLGMTQIERSARVET